MDQEEEQQQQQQQQQHGTTNTTNTATTIEHDRSNINQLYQEVNELLGGFCSDAQQQFCIEQHIASPMQLRRISQTMQQVLRFIPVIGLVDSANSDSLRHTLLRTALEITGCLDTACRQRHIAPLTEAKIEQLLDKWHELSRAYDDKSREHGKLTELLGTVGQLKKAWRRVDQVDGVLTSILASYGSVETRRAAGLYVAMVDKQNYAQLGLSRKAVGRRHIVFECTRLTRDQQIDAVTDICRRFGAVFMHNARHNLQQIDAQLSLARPTTLAHRLRQLHSMIYHDPNNNTNNNHPPRRRVLSHGDAAATTTTITPFRLTSPVTTPSFIWYPRDNGNDDFPVASMPEPSFVPAPWQWTDLIKPRIPFKPLLFGLFRRPRRSHHHRRHEQQEPQQQEQADIDSQEVEPSVQPTDHDNNNNNHHLKNAPFATVSVDDLSQHLCRVGYQFYEDVANNAHLSYHQDSRVLQGVGQDLVEIYTNLQLESARLVMHRVVAICHELGAISSTTTNPGMIENTSITTLQHQHTTTTTQPRPSIASV
ncbi:predicted protein [Lichtheimia corymbifera JMRC:FSU:9682]|uniref:Uncharacterized protein n=1 Tax=Lichtheimia corymbifera JMRC:FSU:9682 TaxID=1263082 RepID=A0A068RYC1_9FUNG|nr:predicted protein [Lichtheimia corymbifera JMRC:FSU:9682]